MNKANKENKLLVSLWKLVGVDAGICTQAANEKTKLWFSLAGVWFVLLFLIIVGSAFYTFTSLFQYWHFALLLSIMLAWIISNLYRLMLVSSHKNMLPNSLNKEQLDRSFVVRLIFIVFLATIISKPIETFLFSGAIEEPFSKFRTGLVEDFKSAQDKFFNSQEARIKEAIGTAISIQEILTTSNDEIIDLQDELELLHKERSKALTQFDKLVKKGSFFTVRLNLLNSKYPVVWLFTIFITLCFLVPIFILKRIPPVSNYNEKRGEVDIFLVLNHYRRFKKAYSAVFKQKNGIDKQVVEHHIDPPFNTKLLPKYLVNHAKKGELIWHIVDQSEKIIPSKNDQLDG